MRTVMCAHVCSEGLAGEGERCMGVVVGGAREFSVGRAVVRRRGGPWGRLQLRRAVRGMGASCEGTLRRSCRCHRDLGVLLYVRGAVCVGRLHVLGGLSLWGLGGGAV